MIFDPKTFFSALVSPRMLAFLEAMKADGIERKIPNISWNTAKFIYEKFSEHTPKHILEIGPANGFSTMILGLIPDTHITSIEFSRHAFEELRANIRSFETLGNNPESDEIIAPSRLGPKATSAFGQEDIGHFSVYYGDARDVLPAFVDGAAEFLCKHPANRLIDVPRLRFDAIFIDGAFRMTREFFDLSRPLLSPGGIIILDDAIKYRWKMAGFHEYLTESGITYELIQTDEDDGVMIISTLTGQDNRIKG